MSFRYEVEELGISALIACASSFGDRAVNTVKEMSHAINTLYTNKNSFWSMGCPDTILE